MGKSEHQVPGAMDEPFKLVEETALASLREADENPCIALRKAIRDAVADFLELERRTRCAERLVSRRFVRAAVVRKYQC